MSNLRRGQCWKTRHLSIQEEEMTPLEGLRGSSLDIEVVLDRSVSHVLPWGCDLMHRQCACCEFDSVMRHSVKVSFEPYYES